MEGVQRLAPTSDALIVVDVLSFSTCVDIAVGRGAAVFPYASKDESAQVFAHEQDALLASRDRTARYSLSPASLMDIPAGTRLVLPSPNGATLSLAGGTTPTFTACLRNAAAVAQAAQQLGKRVSVIPAGERWRPAGTLRPALEDWLGAGAVIQALVGAKSPEAQAAEILFLRFQDDLAATLNQIGSGQELIHRGFAGDVALAAALNVSACVPRLIAAAYVEI